MAAESKMTTPTRSSKLQVGRYDATAVTHVDAPADVLMSSTQSFVFGDATAKNIVKLPAGSQIVDIIVSVDTAFDAATTNLLTVGIDGNDDLYVNDFSVATAGRAAMGAAAMTAEWHDIGTSDVQIQLLYTQSGTAAAAGAARVTILWVHSNDLA